MSSKSPLFLGSAGAMTPMPGALMTKNAYGIDVLPRQFHCPRSLVQSKIPSQGSPDFFYPNLKATGNYTILETEGLSCILTVEYKGLVNNVIPPVLVSYGVSTKTASISRVVSSETRAYSIVYQTDVVTAKYITSGLSFRPSFSVTNYAYRIITSVYTVESSGDSTRLGRVFLGSPSAPTIISVSDGVRRLPVPGTPFYECEESWSYLIQ